MSSAQETEADVVFMTRALQLARRGLGTTAPNPAVGAVIVRDGVILGEGYHEKAGEPHAERRALADAVARGNGALLPGSAIYVTLEPCSSYGRTPPCTEGIIAAGIAEVVYGSTDPDERHRGRADAVLAAAGVRVRSGVLKEACDTHLRPWMFAVRNHRPWVLAKVACTMDARLTRRADRWLSGEESLCYAHRLRLESDAVLIGGNTLRWDNPSLTVRTPGVPIPAVKQQPLRVVLTRNRSALPADAAVFTDAHAGRTLVFENVDDLPALLSRLYCEHGVVQLMTECGGRLLRQFLESGLINEWVQVQTPWFSGGAEELLPGAFLTSERRLVAPSYLPSGRDLIIRGLID